MNNITYFFVYSYSTKKKPISPGDDLFHRHHDLPGTRMGPWFLRRRGCAEPSGWDLLHPEMLGLGDTTGRHVQYIYIYIYCIYKSIDK